MNDQLEGPYHQKPDQSVPDFSADLRREYYCGRIMDRGTVAPCTFCEWCGVCVQSCNVHLWRDPGIGADNAEN